MFQRIKEKLIFLQKIVKAGSFPYLLLILVNYIVYLKTLAFKFTWFDDNNMILAKGFILQNSFSLKSIFSSIYKTPDGYFFYRPLLQASLYFDAFLGGISPFYYHLTNFLLHLISCVLLYEFLKLFEFRRSNALLFALLFAVHPVLVSAVAWVPGRNDVLLFVFFIASFIFLLKFLQLKNYLFSALHILFFLFALLTKESAVVGIVIFLLYLFMVKREKKIISIVALMSGWIVTVGIWYFLRYNFSNSQTSPELIVMVKNIITGLPALVLYIGKIVFPLNLSVLPLLKDSTLWYGWAALLFITVASLVFRRYFTMRYITFGISWFLLFIFPTMVSSVPIYLEHRLYLPMAWFIIFLYGVLGKWLEKIPKSALYGAGGIICIVFSLINFFYSDVFSNRFVLWESAVRTSPSSAIVHAGLASAYIDYNLPEYAEKELSKALSLDPLLAPAYRCRALLYMNKGLFTEAEKDLEKAKVLESENWHLYNLYAKLRLQQNRLKESISYQEKTLILNPEYYDGYKTLMMCYVKDKDTKKSRDLIVNLNKSSLGRKIVKELIPCLPVITGQNRAETRQGQ
jgi:hypothetical protein